MLVPIEVKRDREKGKEEEAGPSGKKQKNLEGEERVFKDPRVQHPKKLFRNKKLRKLYKNGYVVIDLGLKDNETTKPLLEIRRNILEQLQCFKPLSDSEKRMYLESETLGVPGGFDKSFAMGGFSALGTADSFHCPEVRDLRRELYDTLFVPFLKELADGRKIEMLVDRVLIREPGKKPTAESWHRDESTNAKEDDIIFGGWMNLNSKKSQYFSMIPKTHRLVTGENTKGFNTFKKKDIFGFDAIKERIEIPPGHILIFYQNSVHEVLSKAQKNFIQWRLFTGVRLTFDDKPLVPDIQELLENQDVIPLKSGQPAPIYAKMHLNFSKHVKNLAVFTESNLIEPLMEPYTGAFSIKNPEEFGNLLIPKTKKTEKGSNTYTSISLRELADQGDSGGSEASVRLYQPYEQEELRIYLPQEFPSGA